MTQTYIEATTKLATYQMVCVWCGRLIQPGQRYHPKAQGPFAYSKRGPARGVGPMHATAQECERARPIAEFWK